MRNSQMYLMLSYMFMLGVFITPELVGKFGCILISLLMFFGYNRSIKIEIRMLERKLDIELMERQIRKRRKK